MNSALYHCSDAMRLFTLLCAECVRFAQLALPFRLSTMSIEGGAKRIGVGCLLAAFVLHSNKQFVVVANDLIIAAHNQVIIGGLRCAALQLLGTRVACSECDSRQAGNVRTTPTRESVLGARAAPGVAFQMPNSWL